MSAAQTDGLLRPSHRTTPWFTKLAVAASIAGVEMMVAYSSAGREAGSPMRGIAGAVLGDGLWLGGGSRGEAERLDLGELEKPDDEGPEQMGLPELEEEAVDLGDELGARGREQSRARCPLSRQLVHWIGSRQS